LPLLEWHILISKRLLFLTLEKQVEHSLRLENTCCSFAFCFATPKASVESFNLPDQMHIGLENFAKKHFLVFAHKLSPASSFPKISEPDAFDSKSTTVHKESKGKPQKRRDLFGAEC